MESATATFHWSDYITFGGMLLISAVIGLAFSRKRKAKSADGLFVGSRKMTLLPVTMSAFATFMSAVAILGGPLEVYYNGMAYCYIDMISFIGTAFSCFIFVPFFYRLGYVSVYEYMRFRFNSTVSMMAAVLSQLGLFLYMSVVLYAPSSAFSQISGLSLWITIPCVGIICTIYTAFGGLQGVMWTDVWQSAFMFVGLITIIIVGTINVGGADQVLEAVTEGGRFSFDIDTTFNPLIRHSLLSVVLGGGFFVTSTFCSQPLFQRYISCKTLKTAQISTWLCLLANVGFAGLVYAVGLVAFAYFTCDPLLAGQIKRTEHLMPYTVMKTMAVPGITGLFLACTFSGSLSTISSCINSISMVIIVDFIGPIRRVTHRAQLSDKAMAKLSKVIAIILGVLMIGLAFLCESLSTLLLQITMSIGGMTIGPCFGVMSTGMFLPFVNSAGAISGFAVSALFAVTVGIGSAVTGITSYSPKLPLSVHGCADANVSAAANFSTATTTTSWYFDYAGLGNYSSTFTTSPAAQSGSGGITEIFRLSYLLYSLTSWLIFLLVSIVVSLLTKCNKKRPVDPHLIYWTRQKWDHEIGSKKKNYEDESADHLDNLVDSRL